MASPTELAREAMKHSRTIRNEFDLLKQLRELRDLPGLQGSFKILESKIGVLETTVAELKRHKEESSKWQLQAAIAGSLMFITIVSQFAIQFAIIQLKK